MGARLRAVPERAPRAIGIIRVSAKMGRSDEDLISPDTQRVAIIDAAARRGYELIDWVEGIDESGTKARSPWWDKLDSVVARIEAGEADIALGWKFSRAARHRVKFAVAIERVEAAGGRLESATEDFDVTTATGRLGRGMVNELSVFQAELIGEGWKEAHAARIRAGKPHSGGPRFGYLYDKEAKTYLPDPETGPLLVEMYRRFTAGESATGLAHWLNANGYRTTRDRPWSASTLLKAMDAGFGAGKVLYNGTLHPGVHEPVIDERAWQRYQDTRARNRRQAPRRLGSPWPLSGLLFCGECGRPMHVGLFGTKGSERPYARCARRFGEGRTGCTMGRYVPMPLLEDCVLAWLADRAASVDELSEQVDVAAARKVTHEAAADRLAREVGRVEAELTRLAIANARTPLPEVIYDRTVAELTAQLEQLQASAEEAARQARDVVLDVGVAAAGLLGEWEDLPATHRREMLRRLLAGLVVLVDETADGGFRFWPVPAWCGR